MSCSRYKSCVANTVRQLAHPIDQNSLYGCRIYDDQTAKAYCGDKNCPADSGKCDEINLVDNMMNKPMMNKPRNNMANNSRMGPSSMGPSSMGPSSMANNNSSNMGPSSMGSNNMVEGYDADANQDDDDDNNI